MCVVNIRTCLLFYLKMRDTPAHCVSTLLMITRLIANKDSILNVLDETPNRKLSLPTENDWSRLASLATILKPLEQETVQLGEELYSSCEVVLPLLSHLLYTVQPKDDAGYISKV